MAVTAWVFSLFLTLFICPSFLSRPSRMTKFAFFQTHIDPFTGEDQIRKALKVRSPPSFHSEISIMCLPSRLSSPFPSLGVPLELPDPSTFGCILWRIHASFCTCSIVASYLEPYQKATIRSFHEWTREGSKLVYQVTATPVRLSWKECISNSSSFAYAPIFR